MAALCGIMLVTGCEPDPGAADTDNGELVRFGPIQTCDVPAGGATALTLAERGLDDVMPSTLSAWGLFTVGYAPSGMEDLDNDGDIDFYIDLLTGQPRVRANDGTGHFGEPIELPALPPPDDSQREAKIMSLFAADMDGDWLPEMFAAGVGFAAWWPNLGDMQFGEPVVLFTQPWSDATVYFSILLGDFSGDGVLDLYLPPVTDADSPPGTDGIPVPFRRFEGTTDGFIELEPLDPLVNLVSVGTDRDLDGDLDILAWSDRMAPTVFYQNIGGNPPKFVDDAPAIGATLTLAGMGMDGRDVNGDGYPDYCVTDVGPPLCLASDGVGGWYEAARSWGLDPKVPIHQWASTVGWSFEFVDFENDGWTDVVQCSAPHNDMAEDEPEVRFPDLIWQGGTDGRFTDITDTTSFGDPEYDFGLVATVLDGDGGVDVVVVGPDRTPRLWSNGCTEGGFLDVEFGGPPGNGAGIGARVRIKAGDFSDTREVYALRSPMGSPTRLHFGLGAATTVDDLSIIWPDGYEMTLADFAANRIVTLVHPNARP